MFKIGNIKKFNEEKQRKVSDEKISKESIKIIEDRKNIMGLNSWDICLYIVDDEFMEKELGKERYKDFIAYIEHDRSIEKANIFFNGDRFRKLSALYEISDIIVHEMAHTLMEESDHIVTLNVLPEEMREPIKWDIERSNSKIVESACDAISRIDKRYRNHIDKLLTEIKDLKKQIRELNKKHKGKENG